MMISYEAAPGAEVIVKGSRVVKGGWEPSTNYKLDPAAAAHSRPRIYQLRLDDIEFHGYNPFGMVNMMQDRIYLNPTPAELRRHLFRRGMVFVDGKRLEDIKSHIKYSFQMGLDTADAVAYSRCAQHCWH